MEFRNSGRKILPLDKTVVTEFKIQVADIYTRMNRMSGAIPAKVPRDSAFVSADANVTIDTPVDLSGISSFIAIQTFSNLLLDIENDSGVITNVPCNGLFILYGALKSVKVKTISADGTRFTYVYA